MQHVLEVGGPGTLQGAHATVDGSRRDNNLSVDLASPMRPHNICRQSDTRQLIAVRLVTFVSAL